MDLEDELEAHCIRKSALRENLGRSEIRSGKPNNSKVILEYIPSTLKSLSTLSECCWDDNVISILGAKVHFKYCLVYGTIVAKINERCNRCSYMLDDGSSFLDICIYRKDKEMNAVSKFERQLNAIIEAGDVGIITSLKNILLANKKQIHDYDIKAGTKVLVYGRPVYYRNQVSLNVIHILQDNKTDRSMEIAFKDELVDWYKKNVSI